MPHLPLNVLHISAVPLKPGAVRRPEATPQFTKPRPSLRAAGLMKRERMLLSRIGLPSLTYWKTRSFGPSYLTTLYFRTAFPTRTDTVLFFSA